MNDDIDLEKIKDRIAKLLAMSKDVSSPNEAAIAAGRARALMDKYQLNAFDVSRSITEEFGEYTTTDIYINFPRHLSPLAVAVARYNDCQAVFDWTTKQWAGKTRNARRLKFKGYKSDAELATQMFDRLADAIARLCKEYIALRQHDGDDTVVSDYFKRGAADIIIEKLVSMTKERDAITHVATGTALMVVKAAAVSEHFGVIEYVDSSRRSVGDAKGGYDSRGAYVHGRIKGDGVDINHKID